MQPRITASGCYWGDVGGVAAVKLSSRPLRNINSSRFFHDNASIVTHVSQQLIVRLTKVIERKTAMTKMELEQAIGENTCEWCFSRDEDVLRHAKSGTYWHEDCAEAAGDVIHHIIDSKRSNKASLS